MPAKFSFPLMASAQAPIPRPIGCIKRYIFRFHHWKSASKNPFPGLCIEIYKIQPSLSWQMYACILFFNL